MSGESDDFLVEHGLGRLERRLRLGGRLALDGGPELPAELCLTASGAWLLARDGRFVGHAIDAADPGQVRYERGALSDRLSVGEQSLSVPPGRAREARKLIALGRLRRQRVNRATLTLPLTSDRYLTADGELVRELVTVLVEPPDQLIARVDVGHDDGLSSLGA